MSENSIEKLTTREILLSISVNLKRICHMLLTDPARVRNNPFLADTKEYINQLKTRNVNPKVARTVNEFLKVGERLLAKTASPEEYLTWSSILRARSTLVK